MKNYTIHYNGGKESFAAFGKNEATQLFKQWVKANGQKPVILYITE